jgi:hypothetical protein
MADGEITLKLDAQTLARLSEQATEAGETVEAIAAGLLEAVTRDTDHEIALRRLEHFDRYGGKTMTVDEAFDELRRRVAEKRARL